MRAALCREVAQRDVLREWRGRSQCFDRLHHREGAAGRTDQVRLLDIVIVERDFQTLRVLRRVDAAKGHALGMRRGEAGIEAVDLLALYVRELAAGRDTGRVVRVQTTGRISEPGCGRSV